MDERQQLKSLNKNEKRFLSRRECAWCDMPLNNTGCAAFGESCTEETRIKRRVSCLKTYKPRNRRGPGE